MSFDAQNCQECGMQFETPNELLNHKRKFCKGSGFDSLNGLMQVQTKHYPIQPYCLDVSSFSSKHSSHHSRLVHSTLQHSNHKLEQSEKHNDMPVVNYVTAAKMRSVLDKSYSSMGRMSLTDKRDYLYSKLDQLKEIKAQYIENGGKRGEFIENVEKMLIFYEKSLQECKKEIIKEEEWPNRPITPIGKLNESQLTDPRNQMKKSKVTEIGSRRTEYNQSDKPLKRVFSRTGSVIEGMNTVYPLQHNIKHHTQQQQPNQSFKLLQKMMQMKSDQHIKLMEIMFKQKQNKQDFIEKNKYATIDQNREGNNFKKSNANEKKKIILNKQMEEEDKYSYSSKIRQKKGINTHEEYKFKKWNEKQLTEQQRILLALQQEQLDELKLISQLPIELQQIKMDSLVRAATTRFEVQKQVLNYQMDKLKYQKQIKIKEEERQKLNYAWATDKRKQLLLLQMKGYVKDYEEQFLHKSKYDIPVNEVQNSVFFDNE